MIEFLARWKGCERDRHASIAEGSDGFIRAHRRTPESDDETRMPRRSIGRGG